MEYKYEIIYEGKTVYKSSSYDDAYYKILDLQPFSIDYALKWGGYLIKEIQKEIAWAKTI